MLFEYSLPEGTRADYVLCDRQGRPMAALETKRASINPVEARAKGCHYAEQLEVPFVFSSNGEEVWFMDHETDAHARQVAGFYSQDDLERRVAVRKVRRDLSTVVIDWNIVDRDYQLESGVKADATEAVSAPEDAETEPLVSAGASGHPLIKYHFCLQLVRCVDVHSHRNPFTPPPPPPPPPRVGVVECPAGRTGPGT